MHLNTETALDLIDGRVDPAAEVEWAAHFSACSYCFALHAEWQALHEGLKRRHLADAPVDMLNNAKRLFRGGVPATPRPGIRQVIATIAFDSFLQPAFAGARGAVESRQLVLRAEDFDIHIRVFRTEDGRELLGQIQPRGRNVLDETPQLHLLHNGERISSVEVNDLGEFYFSFVPDGLLSLQIDLPHLTVVGALDVNDKI